MKLKKIFLWTMIISGGVSLLLGGGIALFGEFEGTISQVFFTIATMSVFAVMGFCGAILHSKKSFHPIAVVTQIMAVLAWILLSLMIWDFIIHFNLRSTSLGEKITVSSILLAILFALISLNFFKLLDKKRFKILQKTNIVLLVIAGIMSLLLSWNVVDDNDVYMIIMATLTGLAVVGIVITLFKKNTSNK